MKHLIRLSILLCILAAHLYGQPVFQNPDFELGSLEGWEELAGGTKFVSDAEAYSGAYCAAIEGRGKLEQVVEGLEPGTDYLLTFYTKALGGGRSNIGMQDYGRGKSAVIVEDTTYQKFEIPFRTGLESTSGMLFIYNLKSTGTIYADDFTLVKDDESAFNSSLPDVPDGFHWEKIEHLSDEFNEDGLDESKWLDYHPYWNGREPSRYSKDNVNVTNDNLILINTSQVDDLSEVANPDQDVWVDAAVITSKNRNVSYGYYEARIKESNISMMSAFWFQGKYSEIDVIENIGAPSNSNGHEKQMHMNTHYYPGGWDNDQTTPRNWTMPYLAGEDYHVYGVWWIDERHMNFYHNGTLTAEVELPGDYDEPMYMFFDTEVFTWEGLPTIESLNNPDLNTMYVDWVRSWELAPGSSVEQSSTSNLPDQSSLIQNYPNPFNPETQIEYQLTQAGPVQLAILNARGEQIRTLVQERKEAGQYRTEWDGQDSYGTPVASGIYVSQLIAGKTVAVHKMVLIR
jgi:hypothetical protein